MYVYISTLNGYKGSTYNYICTVSVYIGPPSGVGSVMFRVQYTESTQPHTFVGCGSEHEQLLGEA